jgi:hypothetical protein
MQFMSCTHGGPLEAEQVKHAFVEYSSRSCICCCLRESFSGGATGGSPCSAEEDSPLCAGYLQLGALVRLEESKSGIVDRVQ